MKVLCHESCVQVSSPAGRARYDYTKFNGSYDEVWVSGFPLFGFFCSHLCKLMSFTVGIQMRTRLKSVTAFVFLLVMLILAYHQTQAPGIRVDSDLDYAAINSHIDFIARQPHTMGSDANREVRDYIVKHLASLGLRTEVQKTTVVYRHPANKHRNTTIANVENIVARLPGSVIGKDKTGQALVLLAHYDSRPLTPGAADDASGTAAILEVARLMVADPAPAHDVLFVITDGEEMGLLGAQGFFRQHPAAVDAGLVLNLEARGSSGVSTMFETSENNDWLVENLVDSAPDLVADSLSYEIYRRMPNDTDLSISKGEGIAGFNFGFVGGFFDYHAMTDTADNLDQKSLAQQANYLLSVARHFAHLEDWQAGSGNATYFTLWKGQLVRYSEGTAVVIGLTILVIGLWVFIGRTRAAALRLGTSGSGILGILALVTIVSSIFESMINYQFKQDDGIARLISMAEWPLAAYFAVTLGICAWFATVVRRGLELKSAVIIPLVLAGVSFLAGRPWQDAVIMVAVLLPLLLILSRRKNPPDIWSAGLFIWWLLLASLVYLAPNASYMVAFPLLSVLLVRGLVKNTSDCDTDLPLTATLLASLVPLLFLPTFIIMAYLALGSSLPQMIMMVTVTGLLLIWPLVQMIDLTTRGTIGPTIFVLGILATLFVALGRDFDDRHPREQGLFLAVDIDHGQSYWVSPDAKPGTWAGDFLGEDASEFNMHEILPGFEQKAMRRQHPGVLTEPASVSVTRDYGDNGDIELAIRLRSPSNAEYINILFPPDMNIVEAHANGIPVPVPPSRQISTGVAEKPGADKNADNRGGQDWWRWRWYGLPEDGAEIVLRLADDKPVEVKIVEIKYGMPAGVPKRPVDVMARKYTWSDSKVIFQTLRFDP